MDVNGWHLYIYIKVASGAKWDDQEIKEDIVIETIPKESHA